ncbi:thiolase family protein [Chengkuizengella axinellae]|uniref:acetyl-CoA C-acetyltransferase n=1 Tax=Chengkuizengella axinellae TaxID=3064388 RepID=A0ABT9J3R4_9BACL|nr:thiolase family protein [Chengkuizengella sp. 2205SS18-9]MDP5275624.1 thiolase family protein [Chengkuizengella sp. 2205SS18-9]
MEKVKVISGVRSPFGKFGGSLKDFSTISLSALVMNEVVRRSQIPTSEVEEVNWGVCTQSEAREVLAPVIARQALLKAGLPDNTVSMTIDKACCSGLASISESAKSIQLGEVHTSIAGGAEVMSRTPMVIRNLRWGSRLGDVVIRDPAYEIKYYDYNLVSIDASDVALEYGVTREEQDIWAYESHQKWRTANQANKFDDELMSVTIPKKREADILFQTDEFPRPTTTVEKLSQLPTVLGSKTITAGNAPGLNDGAVSVMLMSEQKAQRLGKKPIAEIISTASVADDPRMMATVPGLAIKKALTKADLNIKDLDFIEINEAFAAVPLVSALILTEGDRNQAKQLHNRMNVNGGAVAIGHPVGASGARILLTLIHELKRRGGGYGAASICGGLAQGEAMIVKVD